jgi:hypothetical protein
VAVLPHVFGHSLMARMWGIKSDLWKLTSGHGGDLLLLPGVDEKVGIENESCGSSSSRSLMEMTRIGDA